MSSTSKSPRPRISVLYACAASIVFKMFSAVVEFSTDAVFYCLALEAEGASRRQARMLELYKAASAPALAPAPAQRRREWPPSP
mmetsp:Transcript_142543/g.346372  ORF Transcript_142543/g.346372 Transcript_142543/m.346372 type:complete len:84 (-) Transcript_142543:103-354(-)